MKTPGQGSSLASGSLVDRKTFLALTAAIAAAACSADHADDTSASSESAITSCPWPAVAVDARFYGWRAPAPMSEGWDDETPLARHYAGFFGRYESTGLYKSLDLTPETDAPPWAKGKLLFRLRAVRQYLGRAPEAVDGYWYLHFDWDRSLELVFVDHDPEVFADGGVRGLEYFGWIEHAPEALRLGGTWYRRVACDGAAPPPPPPPDACDTSWATPASAPPLDAFREGLVGSWVAEGSGGPFRRLKLRRDAFGSMLNPSMKPVFRYVGLRPDGSGDEGYYGADAFRARGTGQILLYGATAFPARAADETLANRCVRLYTLERAGCRLVAKTTYVGPGAEPPFTLRKEGCAE